MKEIVFYDCEIEKCIPESYSHSSRYDDDGDEYDEDYKEVEDEEPEYEYCEGWHDFKGMGIACIATFSTSKGYNLFLSTELEEFKKLIDQADEIVGFNSISFDDNLLLANDIGVKTSYDFLCETRVAAGMPPHYVRGITRAGYRLQDLALQNLGVGKSMSGSEAPMAWQERRYKEVAQYCLDDVSLLVQLWERRSRLIDPNYQTILFLRGGDRLEWISAKIKQWIERQIKYWQRSDLRVFLWAIVHSDIKDCRINIYWPIYWRFSLAGKELMFEIREPHIKVTVPYKLKLEFRDKITNFYKRSDESSLF